MSLDSATTFSALALAWASFIAFCFVTKQQREAAKDAGEKVKDAIAKTSETKGVADLDIGKLLEGAATLVDSLAKAGPSLSALAASVLFLAIAAYNVNKGAASSPAQPAATEAAKPSAPAK
jgi:hypothetical protein